MADKMSFTTTVTYADVDRREVMLLPRIFKLLQEAAITHANAFGAGAEALARFGGAWVLNRIAARIERYPRHDESLRVETWSTGIKGFRGFREFRLRDHAGNVIVAATSIWVYVSVETKTVGRIPAEIADGFPVNPEPAAWPGFEKVRFGPPEGDAARVSVSLRYSDFDINEHVNNAAYLDFVQTALAASGRTPAPRSVQLNYARAIPADRDRVEVRIGAGQGPVRFSIEWDGVVFAQGQVEE